MRKLEIMTTKKLNMLSNNNKEFQLLHKKVTLPLVIQVI